ncbi:MAG TPA: hypothetical protein PLV32_12530 [Chitinophagaceae bacterium]|nr:hypothetical protein [Chitinophagaceae bacterium]
MKKFLAVFDGFKISGSTMDYAIQLTKAANAHLVGLFLDEFLYRSYNVSAVIKKYDDYEAAIKLLDEKDKKKRDAAVSRFQKACGKAGIKFSIRRSTSIAIQDLKHESMFADMIIIKDLLADVQCPVLVVPEKFKAIDKIVMLYDGGPSALYACKMFSYLLGDLVHQPIEVLTIKNR